MEQFQDHWPYRLYGPSNYRGRKPELIPAEVVVDEGRQFVRMELWLAWNLAREQSRKAFEAGEISPDALMHATTVIYHAIGKGDQLKHRGAQEKLSQDTRIHDLIVWGLLQSRNIPDSYLMSKGHPSLLTKDMTRIELLQFVLNSDFRVDRGNCYLWENVNRLLRVTAQYLDSRRRIQTASAEEDPDLPN